MRLKFSDKEIPNEKGSYCLVFELKEQQTIQIGKPGKFLFETGYYSYFGSAQGSGGLRPRISRYLLLKKNIFGV